MQELTKVQTFEQSPAEYRFDNSDRAVWVQAFWKRLFPILVSISYGFAVVGFLSVYFSDGYPPPPGVVSTAVGVTGTVAAILSLALFVERRKQAVATIMVNESGVTLTTTAGNPQTLRWANPHFRLTLTSGDSSYKSPSGESYDGMLYAPRGFLGWPTTIAQDTIIRVARTHGLHKWTWSLWNPWTRFPTATLLAHRLTLADRLRGLRTGRADS
jgi:hypothetical protein